MHPLEVSVFGPGVGECVLLAPRPDYWIVVDSCRVDGVPVALRYIEDQGHDPAAVVREVICTHWHDDHHDGIADVLRRCVSARFWCSAALRSEEFLTLAGSARRQYDKKHGVDEMAEVLKIIHERRAKGVRAAAVGPQWADESKRLVREPDFSLWSLSPSAATLTRAHNEFAELVPKLKSPKRRLAANEANDTAVVLHLETESHGSVLLGSDLEIQTDPTRGWTAAFSSFRGQGLRRAHTYKVAHHGSKNGHAPEIWDSMVEPTPTVLLTPFRSCRLPGIEDLKRIRQAHEGATYITANPRGAKPRRRSNSVEKTMRMVSSKRRLERTPGGQLRVRVRADGTRSVEMIGTAFEVGTAETA